MSDEVIPVVDLTTSYVFYNELGEPEYVNKERWQWEVYYTDGTALKQFDDDLTFHQFREIDQTKISIFRMINGEKPPIVFYWLPGRKLIHFYRNIFLRYGTPEETKIKLYCFGFQDENTKVIFVILPGDEIVIVDDVDKLVIE